MFLLRVWRQHAAAVWQRNCNHHGGVARRSPWMTRRAPDPQRRLTIGDLASDLAGAQSLQPTSVTVMQAPNGAGALTAVFKCGHWGITFGFVSTDSLCVPLRDNSTPTPLCASANLTIVVVGRRGDPLRAAYN